MNHFTNTAYLYSIWDGNKNEDKNGVFDAIEGDRICQRNGATVKDCKSFNP